MTADAWTRINGPGKIPYDDDATEYDSPVIAYDGGDGNDWVPISKPTS